MLALYICLLTGLVGLVFDRGVFPVVWLWLVWDMTREVRAGWGRGASLKLSRKKALEPEPEPTPPPARDPRDWMSE